MTEAEEFCLEKRVDETIEIPVEGSGLSSVLRISRNGVGDLLELGGIRMRLTGSNGAVLLMVWQSRRLGEEAIEIPLRGNGWFRCQNAEGIQFTILSDHEGDEP